MMSLRIIASLTLFIYAHAQNIAYDCTSDQSNYTTISLVEIAECSFKEEDFTEESTQIQLLQSKESHYVSTFSCLVSLNYEIFNCGMHSHNSLVKGGIVAENYQLGRDECLRSHLTRRVYVYGQEYHVETFNETSTRWITLAGGIDHDGTCTGAAFNNRMGSYKNVVAHGQLKMMLSTGTAVKVIKQSNSVRLPSGITCPSDSISCIDPTFGYTYWKDAETYSCADDAYHVIYQGPASKVITTMGTDLSGNLRKRIMFTVKEPEQIFTLLTMGTTELCRYTVHQTEHPQYWIVEVSKGVFPFLRKPIPTNDLDIFMYINAKIVHVARGVELNLRTIYKTLSVEICELEREHLKTLTSMAFVSPISFAYQYMNSPGYTAISAGEVIHIIKCLPVPIVPRSDPDCTIEHPVSYANQSYYITPRSHLLQKTGTPTPCADILTPEYKIGDSWYSFRHGMRRTNSPIVLSPKVPTSWKGLDLGNVIRAGIYTPKQIDEVRHQIMYPQERKAINEILTGTLNGDSISHTPLDYTLILDKSALKNQFRSWWLETWGWFKFIGEMGSTVFSLYIILLIFKFFLTAIFRLKALHELFGCSLIMLTSVLDGVADYILHRNSHKYNPSTHTEHEVESKHVDPELGLMPTAPRADEALIFNELSRGNKNTLTYA